MKILYVVVALLVTSEILVGGKIKFEHGPVDCEVCYQKSKPCALLDSEIMALKIIREILFSREDLKSCKAGVDESVNYQAIGQTLNGICGDALVIDRYEFLKNIFGSISYLWGSIFGTDQSLFYASSSEVDALSQEYVQLKKQYDSICGPILQTSFQRPDRDEQRRIALRHKQFLLTWVKKIDVLSHRQMKA